MASLRTWTWISVTVAAAAFAGCGGKGAPAPKTGAESPLALLQAFRAAFASADEARIRALIDPTNAKAAAQAAEFYAVQATKIRARNDVREAFLAKFGRTAWEVSPPGGGETMEAWYAANLDDDALRALEGVNESWVKVEDDRATVEIGDVTWDLKKKDGLWRIDPGPEGRFRPSGIAEALPRMKRALDLARHYKARLDESKTFEEFAATRDR